MRKPFRLDLGGDPLADHDRAILVEGAVIAEAGDIEFQRFGFQQPLARHVVDHEMREIRLARDRADRGEFRRGEAHHDNWCRLADWARGRAAPFPGCPAIPRRGRAAMISAMISGHHDRPLRGLTWTQQAWPSTVSARRGLRETAPAPGARPRPRSRASTSTIPETSRRDRRGRFRGACASQRRPSSRALRSTGE